MMKEKLSPTERPMLFEIDPEPVEEALTALGGLPLLAPGLLDFRAFSQLL